VELAFREDIMPSSAGGMDRRQFLGTTAATAALRLLAPAAAAAQASPIGIKAVASDSFAIFDALKPWADVPPILESLRKRNMRLAILSNLTCACIQARSSHLQHGAGRFASVPR
jgi:hypothetical protein